MGALSDPQARYDPSSEHHADFAACIEAACIEKVSLQPQTRGTRRWRVLSEPGDDAEKPQTEVRQRVGDLAAEIAEKNDLHGGFPLGGRGTIPARRVRSVFQRATRSGCLADFSLAGAPVSPRAKRTWKPSRHKARDERTRAPPTCAMLPIRPCSRFAAAPHRADFTRARKRVCGAHETFAPHRRPRRVRLRERADRSGGLRRRRAARRERAVRAHRSRRLAARRDARRGAAFFGRDRAALCGGLGAATGDLRANQFACAAPSTGRGGDPPDQVCRRTETEGDCTHTWQAHLWDDAPGVAAKVSRVRGLYDMRCKADEGLLGGPG